MEEVGDHVFATDVNMETLSTSRNAKHENIDIFELDVLNDDNALEGVSRAAPDELFNCAGFKQSGTILGVQDGDLDFTCDLNLRVLFRTIRASFPGILERGLGSITNMSSTCSSMIVVRDWFIYCTTKAIMALTKSVAIDYFTQGIRCNAICPGTVDSPSLHDRLRATDNYYAAMKPFVMRQPTGPIAQTEKIAALVVYLASYDSAFIKGQGYVIDGGWSG